jgi:hypothetical protein
VFDIHDPTEYVTTRLWVELLAKDKTPVSFSKHPPPEKCKFWKNRQILRGVNIPSAA